MNCKNCNAPLDDDALFCSECGHIVENEPQTAPEPEIPQAALFCSECGSPIAAGDTFCGSCGTPVGGPVPEAGTPDVLADPRYDGPAAPKKPFPLKVLIMAGAAVLLAVLAFLLIPKFTSGEGKTHNYAAYIKDGELQYLSMPKGKEPLELTSRLLDGDYDDSYTESQLYLTPYIQMSSNGKRLFFPDKIEASSYGGVTEFGLYYRNVKNEKKEAEKIDSGITRYTINEAGTLVVYLKDGNLYQHNLKEKTKIDGDVVSYRMSKDGKTLVYLVKEEGETEGSLYLKSGKNEAEKITSGVTHLSFVTEDFSRIHYYKDTALYVKVGSNDPEKIASDVLDAKFYDNGSVFYSKEADPILQSTLIINDLEGEEAESLAEELKQESGWYWYSIHFYDGKDSTQLTDCALEASLRSVSSDTPVLAYITLPESEMPSYKASEVQEDPYSYQDKLAKDIMSSSVVNVASGTVVTDLDIELSFTDGELLISKDGKSIYFLTEYNEDNENYVLRKITLHNGLVKEDETLDDEVYDEIEMVGESSVLYFKDVNDDDEGELFLDGNKIADDVYVWDVNYNEENGNVYYMVDWDYEKELGTLMYHNGKKSQTIKDDVHKYVLTPGSEVLFLYDVNLSSYEGELWIMNGKKPYKLDDDVTNIVYIMK